MIRSSRAVQILRVLRERGHSGTELLERTGIPPGSLYATLRRMHAQGLVSIQRYALDLRRRVYRAEPRAIRELEALDKEAR